MGIVFTKFAYLYEFLIVQKHAIVRKRPEAPPITPPPIQKPLAQKQIILKRTNKIVSWSPPHKTIPYCVVSTRLNL